MTTQVDVGRPPARRARGEPRSPGGDRCGHARWRGVRAGGRPGGRAGPVEPELRRAGRTHPVRRPHRADRDRGDGPVLRHRVRRVRPVDGRGRHDPGRDGRQPDRPGREQDPARHAADAPRRHDDRCAQRAGDDAATGAELHRHAGHDARAQRAGPLPHRRRRHRQPGRQLPRDRTRRDHRRTRRRHRPVPPAHPDRPRDRGCVADAAPFGGPWSPRATTPTPHGCRARPCGG